MEPMNSVWCHQSFDDLKNMLLYTTVELETVRNELAEEIRRNDANVKQLLHLIKVSCQERDEARDQLHILLNKLMPSSSTEICPLPMQPTTPPVYPMKGNSSITESDNLSETYNHHSYGSSHADSFLGVVSSPELSNINMADSSNIDVPHHAFVQEYKGLNSIGMISSGITEPDRASAVIDNLVKGKTLPEKGNLLQTVMEAGPLLQTLLVSGPLPRWRNPPPLQHFQMPTFSINGGETERGNQKWGSNLNYPIHNSLSLSYADSHYRSSQMYPTTALNFTSTSTCLSKGKMLSTAGGDFIHNPTVAGKRQRCQ